MYGFALRDLCGSAEDVLGFPLFLQSLMLLLEVASIVSVGLFCCWFNSLSACSVDTAQTLSAMQR